MVSASHVTIRKRLAWLFLFVTLVMIGLAGRLVYLQFFQSSWLTEHAADQRLRHIPVEAKRGIIFDRNGKELAVSVSTESLYAIPAQITDADQTAAKLAAILPLDRHLLVQKLKRRQAFIWLDRKIDDAAAQEIKKLNLPGIGLTQENRRHYPYENLASHVLGFTGIDSQGLDGIELTFDNYLRGRPGGIVVENDARGREIPYSSPRYVAPVEGNNVYLTIDIVIQQIVERELEQAMKNTQAKGGSILVMDPQTGELLAMASRPDYDPNRFAEYPSSAWRNIAVSNSYEPGSTFKIIPAAVALEEKLVTLDSRFYDPGSVEVQGRHIHCHRRSGHGSQTFLQIVENSCNVGFVNVGLRIGKDRFYDYIDAFGFGRLTDVDLPGEAKGLVINRQKVKPINIATISIGQSIAVTPLQLVSAVSAVANGGKLLRPQIVREVQDHNGQFIRAFHPDVKVQVLDAATSKKMTGILESVVENGTGKNAYIPGMHIGGKTGTAQKAGAGGGYASGKYVGSFIGMAPANAPRIVVLVVIDEPQGLYYGGQIAAPVASNVIKNVMQYLGLSAKDIAPKPGDDTPHTTVPNVINLSLSEAVQELRKAGLDVKSDGTDGTISDQVPKPFSRVPQGSSILLYSASPRFSASEVTVPSLEGYEPKQAIQLLSELGFIVETSGSGGTIVMQEPSAGKKVPAGSSVMLYLE
ncbi:stage V sporulation protein D [Acetonema longum]|uniref:Stage V sporulation protein D n=1 Tax=Acetonema longum DSM 6540 TaxID=1009370 RepID=F7NPY9_9FIRM|nr:stage V sporulation protein D [Acetonema longum]EGO61980.1 stage V sporulation protein D [Acetonema longum DSM 6540]